MIYDEAEGKACVSRRWLRVVSEGRFVRADGRPLRVARADAITLLVTAATGYQDSTKPPTLQRPKPSPRDAARQLDARAKPYDTLARGHVADHQKLFRRVTLESRRQQVRHLPTDERLEDVQATRTRPCWHSTFQYGRYLLIASSRPGTLPANLQGIWNNLVTPPWSSNWTTNINVQMNYWPAETTNLSECHEPLFDLIEGVGRTGQETAEINYDGLGIAQHRPVAAVGARRQLRTRVADVGQLANERRVAVRAPLGTLPFTRDGDFLRRRAYPVMKGAAEFCRDWLIDGHKGT